MKKKMISNLEELSKLSVEEIADHYAKESVSYLEEMNKEFDPDYEADNELHDELKEHFLKFLRKKEKDYQKEKI